ncbi:MAG: hypothetical protein OXI87_07905 [Albidovulum sp.]|nr:hypothetical protein [Albidovulum sp.]MDE0534576.1 hypothetical protein [Albidovulum sp.]
MRDRAAAASSGGTEAAREVSLQVDGPVRVANTTGVIELRLMLVPRLARLAAARASAVQADRVMKEATSVAGDDYGASDLAFRVGVASESRNALGPGLRHLQRAAGADSRVLLPKPSSMCETARAAGDKERQFIARAIADRDPERGEEAMRDRLFSVRALKVNRLRPRPETQFSSVPVSKAPWRKMRPVSEWPYRVSRYIRASASFFKA